MGVAIDVMLPSADDIESLVGRDHDEVLLALERVRHSRIEVPPRARASGDAGVERGALVDAVVGLGVVVAARLRILLDVFEGLLRRFVTRRRACPEVVEVLIRQRADTFEQKHGHVRGE